MHQQKHLSSLAGSNGRSASKGGGLLDSILRRLTPDSHDLSVETRQTSLPNGKVATNFAFVPGPGKHVIRYKNAFLMVERTRETRSVELGSGRPWETVTLTTLRRHRHIVEDDILPEARRLAQQAIEGKLIVYKPSSTQWERFGEPQRKREIDTVVLDKGVKERIVNDVQEFCQSATWYYNMGIPYRRGYLLHGPPGTGKTSFIKALASHLDYDIATLNLGQRGLTDDRLQHLLSVVPERTFLLLEDADAAFSNRRQTDADGYQGANVTFSGLLNALDGLESSEERILFLTTNKPEEMDAALIRPGRVDVIERLGDATPWQIEQFWDRFYGGLDPDQALRAKFLGRLEALDILSPDGASPPAHPTSMASLQGLFLFNKDDPEGAIEMAQKLIPDRS